MAIALDQVSIGTPTHVDAALGSATITTNVAVASGAQIVLLVSWFSAAVSVGSTAGGGLTWSTDHFSANGNDQVAVVSAPAPAGLASGTVITVTFAGGTANGRAVSGASFTGLDAAGAIDLKGANTSLAWTTSSLLTTNAEDLLWAVAMDDGAVLTGSGTAPATVASSFGDVTSNTGWVSGYRIVTSTGTYSIAGLWSGGAGLGNGATAIVAYKSGTVTPTSVAWYVG